MTTGAEDVDMPRWALEFERFDVGDGWVLVTAVDAVGRVWPWLVRPGEDPGPGRIDPDHERLGPLPAEVVDRLHSARRAP
jgi:hypothetical protein